MASGYHELISALIKDEKRNAQIIFDAVSHARYRTGTVLLVSDRVKHCQDLAKKLQQEKDLSTEVLSSKLSSAKREEIVNRLRACKINVLIATVPLIKEGFDYTDFGALVLATPIRHKGTVIQIIGRIRRPGEGKAQPVIYDYKDKNVGVLMSSYNSRLEAYHEEAINTTGY